MPLTLLTISPPTPFSPPCTSLPSFLYTGMVVLWDCGHFGQFGHTPPYISHFTGHLVLFFPLLPACLPSPLPSLTPIFGMVCLSDGVDWAFGACGQTARSCLRAFSSVNLLLLPGRWEFCWDMPAVLRYVFFLPFLTRPLFLPRFPPSPQAFTTLPCCLCLPFCPPLYPALYPCPFNTCTVSLSSLLPPSLPLDTPFVHASPPPTPSWKFCLGW